MSKSRPYSWFLVKNKNFQKNCQTIWFFAVTLWQANSWLSSDCQAIVWMVGWRKELSGVRNSDDRNCQRWQNHENRNMGIKTLTYWTDVWLQFCPTGASCVPRMGKQRSPVGQAPCPSTIPNRPMDKNKRWYIFTWINVRMYHLCKGSDLR